MRQCVFHLFSSEAKLGFCECIGHLAGVNCLHPWLHRELDELRLVVIVPISPNMHLYLRWERDWFMMAKSHFADSFLESVETLIICHVRLLSECVSYAATISHRRELVQ